MILDIIFAFIMVFGVILIVGSTFENSMSHPIYTSNKENRNTSIRMIIGLVLLLVGIIGTFI